MIAWLDSLCRKLTDWHPTRRLLESFFHSSLRGRRAITSPGALAAEQTHILRGLVHRAQHSRYGKEHDFGRVRTVADFRRVTPVVTPESLYRRYWEPAFPYLSGATWPDVQRILENPAPGLPYVPLTTSLLQRAAGVWLAGLGQILAASPRCSLLSGRILGLVDSVNEPLISLAWGRLPWSLRPYLHTRHAHQLGADDFRRPTTCLLGSASQFLALRTHVREQTGQDQLSAVWPDLRGVLMHRTPGESQSPVLRDAVGSHVVTVEVVLGPEGVFAVEDARRTGLRLLPDAGVFYELIPVEERIRETPTRLGLTEAEAGVPYELVTTTPGGLWACRTGIGICLERSDFLATRFVPLPPLPLPRVVPPSDVAQPPTPLKSTRPRNLPGLSVPSPNAYRSHWSSGA